MGNVEAKLRIKGKVFGVLVDSDKAIELKGGKSVNIGEVLTADVVYSDIKKGMKASNSDLEGVFGTTDINVVAEKIIKSGELQVPAEYKNKKREEKLKQIIEFLARNAMDPQSGKPHTPERIKTVIEQSGVNIEDKPIEEQMPKVLDKIKTIIPIKVETKTLKITIPAEHTGRAYAIVKDFKESEKWKDNGDLECLIKLPAGMQMDFYDKLNNITHGAAIAEEIKNEWRNTYGKT